MIIGFLIWFFEWFVHVLFVDRLRDHVTALELTRLKDKCGCEPFSPSAGATSSQRASSEDVIHVSSFKVRLSLRVVVGGSKKN